MAGPFLTADDTLALLEAKVDVPTGGADGNAIVSDGAGGFEYRDLNAKAVQQVDSGAAVTVPEPAAVNPLVAKLTANTTVTFPPTAVGKSFRLVLLQDGVGGRTVTWPTVKWPGGSVPAINTSANKTTVLDFECYDGLTWCGWLVATNM